MIRNMTFVRSIQSRPARNRLAALLGLGLLVSILCSGCMSFSLEEFSPDEISSDSLAGTINGESWRFATGWGSRNSDGDRALITIFSGEAATCGYDDGSENQILISVPLTPGSYPFGFEAGQTGTMVFPMEDGSPMNAIAIEGLLVVHEVTEDSVKAGLVMVSGEHEVNGQFEAILCN